MLFEMQPASFKIRTRVAESISYDLQITSDYVWIHPTSQQVRFDMKLSLMVMEVITKNVCSCWHYPLGTPQFPRSKLSSTKQVLPVGRAPGNQTINFNPLGVNTR